MINKYCTKIKSFWEKQEMHVKITFTTFSLLSISLAVISTIAYQVAWSVMLKRMGGHRFVFRSNPQFVDNFPQMIDPQNDRSMDRFGQMIQDQALLELRTPLISILTISSILIVVIGTTITYLIAKKMLDQIKVGFEKLETFVGDASHELRTPLTVIKGKAELFRMQKGSLKDAKDSMEVIEKQANRMNNLITDLLKIAKLDQSVKDKKESVDLVLVLSECVETLRQLDPQREVRFTSNSPVIIKQIAPNEIWQIAINVLQNIHRYTPENSAVFVNLSQIGNKVQLEFVDHGPGVSTENLDRIFDRFWTNSESRSKDESGTGLGLAIVKEIVLANSGTITAKPTRGGGLTISIML